MLANIETRFHNSIKTRVSLKERGFHLDSSHLQYFETIIAQRGWQEFCNPPKAVTMTVIREFYANAVESPVSTTIVKEKQMRYDSTTINAFFKIQNAPHSPD